jgi:hypothetical protein
VPSGIAVGPNTKLLHSVYGDFHGQLYLTEASSGDAAEGFRIQHIVPRFLIFTPCPPDFSGAKSRLAPGSVLSYLAGDRTSCWKTQRARTNAWQRGRKLYIVIQVLT